MVKAKNKNKTNSNRIHTGKVRFSRRSKINKRSRRISLLSKRTVIVIIILAMATVIIAAASSIFSNPESIVTGKIKAITTDYYENYFYPRIKEYDNADKPLADVLSRYTENGFSRITLRQLLLFDSERYADSATMLSKYCDVESTYVKIFPDPPFSKSDYHVDYHYACTF